MFGPRCPCGPCFPRGQVELPESDLSVSFMRSGGAGGQNVNKVESGVLLRHLPSGLAVRCTQERSQLANRAIALKMLREKLLVGMPWRGRGTIVAREG